MLWDPQTYARGPDASLQGRPYEGVGCSYGSRTLVVVAEHTFYEVGWIRITTPSSDSS